jgi:hypothetical protein
MFIHLPVPEHRQSAFSHRTTALGNAMKTPRIHAYSWLFELRQTIPFQEDNTTLKNALTTIWGMSVFFGCQNITKRYHPSKSRPWKFGNNLETFWTYLPEHLQGVFFLAANYQAWRSDDNYLGAFIFFDC